MPQLLWKQYVDVMDVVRMKYPTEEQVLALADMVEAFCIYYVTNFDNTESHYMHILRYHVPEKLAFIHKKYGIGLGFFSTQASEHGNKLAKSALRFLGGFTALKFNKFDMFIRHRLVRLLHYPDTVSKVLGVTDKCRACGEVGNRRNNKICEKHVLKVAMGITVVERAGNHEEDEDGASEYKEDGSNE